MDRGSLAVDSVFLSGGLHFDALQHKLSNVNAEHRFLRCFVITALLGRFLPRLGPSIGRPLFIYGNRSAFAACSTAQA